MDTTLLKSFATSSRTELIREVAARITAVLAPGSPERVEQPRAVSELERAISAGGGGDKGKAHVADKVAYTWFNRIIALRFMDANGYTGIGVVSPAADQVGQPEILAAAKRGQVDADVVKGANAATIRGLLNGTRQPRPGVDAQAEAYSLLLADYCRYWNRAMPFMFEREADFTELLIPANVLAEDSVLSRSVTVLTEEVCQDVEVIGWLYQFYISERKDEVFAGFKKNKKAGADEIPAATQLFTPHWIVRYLVENSVGRLWMLNHPESRLVDQMEYYIAPVDEEKDFLKISKPEELTVIDPACGSGHMLTYAFDLLYAIYEEEGYTPSQIPGLILTNNLYGTEIDPRAGALAAFALTMKAAAKRRLFLKNPVEPNICVLEPISFSADELSYLVTEDGDRHAEEAFWNQFAEADTFGSLIQPDPDLTVRLAKHLATLDNGGDLLRADALDWAGKALRQAAFLTPGYSVVVANPPYMGSANMNATLTAYAKSVFPEAKSDLFAMFLKRGLSLVRAQGYSAQVTMQSWMYLQSFKGLRAALRNKGSLVCLAHLGNMVMGIAFGTSAAVWRKGRTTSSQAAFARVVMSDITKGRPAPERFTGDAVRVVDMNDFLNVPGEAIVYDLDERHLFARRSLAGSFESGGRLKTHGNAKYVRYHWEVDSNGVRWRPFHNGGASAPYYGNDEDVVDWSQAAVDSYANHGGLPKESALDLPGITWSLIGAGDSTFRLREPGELFSSASPTVVCRSRNAAIAYCAGLNTPSMVRLMKAINPTVNNIVADVLSLPQLDASTLDTLRMLGEAGLEAARELASLAETSRLFSNSPLLSESGSLELRVHRHTSARAELGVRLASIRRESEKAVASDFKIEPRSIGAAEDAENASTATADLVSYAVGCMFGRYSLDEPGLILADQGSTLQDYVSKVPRPTFMPDADNVIPMVDGDWFEDDIVERFRQFLRAAFGEQYFEENLQFVTKSLGVKQLRDYFVKSFYKDHVKRYKKRPIYWLFSSPKGSFNALIYMHRYTPSTVSTVLTYLREYVTKLESALQQAERAGNAKEADRLRKILVELNEYEHDTLFPKASENVVIDLDDGVKVNYPKFGAALKKIPGLEAASD